MGKWIHRLSCLDLSANTGMCSHCGPVRVYVLNGRPSCTIARGTRHKKWIKTERGAACRYRTQKRYDNKFYRIHAKPVCERCGFTAVHQCQIDIHHKDGNHENNNVENLESICGNCHRLEHRLEEAIRVAERHKKFYKDEPVLLLRESGPVKSS